MDQYRHIDMSGLPKGYDLADLIDAGISDADLRQWCKDRVRPGPPKLTKEEMDELNKKGPKKRHPPDPEKAKQSTAALKPTQTSSAVAQAEEEAAPAVEMALDMPPEFSEDSLAEEFTRQYKNTMAYCAALGTWLHWEDNRWKVDDTALAIDLSRKVCREASQLALDRLDLGAKSKTIANTLSSRRVFGAVEGIARSDRRHVVRPSQFDADPWIINTPDGVVDLTTGKLRPADKTDWCVKSTRVGPGGKCPTWMGFLQDCTQGDADLIGYLKRIAGYCLTGSTAEQKFFFIYGGGGNGKGVFLNTLMWLLDSYGRQANMDTFTEQRFTKHASEIAFFQGARLVVASETNVGQRWNEARIKSMTGGDPITANHMHKDPFTFIPNFKLLFTGNHKPHLKNVDPAIKRRLYLIPFDYQVPEEKQDVRLAEKIQAEASGVLSWAIEGCMEWQDRMLDPPDKVIATTAEYFEAEDRIGSFLEECCTVSASERVLTTKLFECYVKWADSRGEYSGGRKGFLDMMSVKGFRSEKKGGEQVMMGVSIAHDQSEQWGRGPGYDF